MNQCGTCTLCCRLTEIPELHKPLNKWCKFCDKKEGCTIYLSRPESCKTFRCLWLIKGLHEKLRPDYSHVIFEVLSRKTFLAIVHPDYSDSWNIGLVGKLIGEILRDGVSIVVIIHGKQSQVLLSADRTVEDVKEELTMALRLYQERVEQWQHRPIQLI